MPWKFISFLCVLILATVFIGFNLDNRCDVSIIFYTFHDVPVFISLLFAYLFGAITLIPFFAFSRKRGKTNGNKTVSAAQNTAQNKTTAKKSDSATADSAQTDSDTDRQGYGID